MVEKDFHEVTLPCLTSQYTERLMKALQLYRDSNMHRREIRALRDSIEQIMRIALEIRSLMLVREEDFECIWPALGSPFDGEQMILTPLSTCSVNAIVRLPLSLGLRAYPGGIAMISYEGFSTVADLGRSPNFIVRALVSPEARHR